MNNRQTQTLRRSLSLFLECEMKAYEKITKVEFTPSPEFQAKIEEYNRAIEDETSSAHKRIRWRIIGIAAVISIMLLITACCFGNTVIEFIKERFSTHTDISISSDMTPTTIETIALPQNIPDGFTQTKQMCLGKIATTIWSNGDSKITLIQQTIDNSKANINTEQKELKEYMYKDCRIQYTQAQNVYTIFWENGEYAFTLNCPSDLNWSAIENIICDIQEQF